MNYRETLFFVGKCLTVNHEKHNFEIVKSLLKNNSIDWDGVVRVSTSHYVFPALYCNLKKANLLSFIPNDLVEYMEYITNLNRERNLKIITQAKALNTFLLKHNITPIFLKGVSNLFQDLYDDVAERMIADIDFLIAKEDYLKTIALVEEFGYSKVEKNKHHSPLFKHHPRLQKEGHFAGVEIHKEVLIEKFADEFNYDIIKDNCIKTNNVTLLGYHDQLSLAILSNQINDDGFYLKNLTLKPAYDVYVISKKTNAIEAFKNFKNLKYPLNCFLASCYQVFNKVDSLKYTKTSETEKYLKTFNTYLTDHKKRKRDYKKIRFKLYLIRKNDFILKTIFHKEYRNWFINDCLIRLNIKKLAS